MVYNRCADVNEMDIFEVLHHVEYSTIRSLYKTSVSFMSICINIYNPSSAKDISKVMQTIKLG